MEREGAAGAPGLSRASGLHPRLAWIHCPEQLSVAEPENSISRRRLSAAPSESSEKGRTSWGVSKLRERDLQMRRREGSARPADSRGQPSGRGPGAGLPEHQVSATAQLYSGKPPPPGDPPSFRNLTASVSTLRNLLRLDPALQICLLGFIVPNCLRHTPP